MEDPTVIGSAPPPMSAPEPPKKKDNKVLIIVIVALIVFCCCCVVIPGILWFTGDSILEALDIQVRNALPLLSLL